MTVPADACDEALRQASDLARKICGSPVREIARLRAGSSNRSYRFTNSAGAFVLRLPAIGVPFVDRVREIEAVRLAYELKIGPELVYADERGLMVTRWLENAQVLHHLSVAGDRFGPVGRLGRSLQILHGSGRLLKGRYDPFQVIDEYTTQAHLAGAGQSVWSERVGGALDAARDASSRSSVRIVPSHCDLVPANCLDDGSRMFLVDWEYAAMCDPAWDLAYFSLEAGLGAPHEGFLLASYADPQMTHGRVQVHKLLAAVLNLAWASLPAIGEKLPNLLAWRQERIAAAELIAADPCYGGWLAELR
jgi:aminoglycoside phosphotransferase (APT) family kinase protein